MMRLPAALRAFLSDDSYARGHGPDEAATELLKLVREAAGKKRQGERRWPEIDRALVRFTAKLARLKEVPPAAFAEALERRLAVRPRSDAEIRADKKVELIVFIMRAAEYYGQPKPGVNELARRLKLSASRVSRILKSAEFRALKDEHDTIAATIPD